MTSSALPIPSLEETASVVKRVFSSLTNPSGGYKMKNEDIIIISKLGSRLWGTYSYTSDYDLLVIHTSKNPNVRHVGATVAKEIDVRLESVDSFLEEMKKGSVRCWLSFLLLHSEISHSEGLNNQQDYNDEDNDDESGVTAHESSMLFSGSDTKKLKDFIAHAISSVKVLQKEVVIQKMAETLAEDEQRVLKTIGNSNNQSENDDGQQKGQVPTSEQLSKAQKIMKHSLRLIFAYDLIKKCMTPAENKEQQSSSSSKAKKAKASSAAVKKPDLMNVFSPFLDLKKDVFSIENKIEALAASKKEFQDCLKATAIKGQSVHAFYGELNKMTLLA